MIELTGVTVKFSDGLSEVSALTSVELTVASGEFVVLHGPSGSGKSTLLNVIAGLQRVTEGGVRVGTVDVVHAREGELSEMRLKQLGFVFQENNLVNELTVLENVQLPLAARKMPSKISLRYAHEALALVGLTAFEHRRPPKLSGGQRQRVGIARAIAGDKPYLLADEPTGALDSGNSEHVFAILQDLAKRGVSVVVASHDQSVGAFATRQLTVKDGLLTGQLGARM